MRKGLIAVAMAVCCVLRAWPQTPDLYPDLSRYEAAPAGKVTFHYRCNGWQGFTQGCNFEADKMKMEVPPWMIPGGWHSYFMVDGKNSYVCSSPANLVVNSDLDIRSDGAGPYDVSTHSLGGIGRGCNDRVPDWSRVYYAIYSAEYFRHPAAGTVSLGFLHAENKDACDGGNDCHNTINRDPSNVCPFKGDYWPRYNSFVCASWIQNNAATNWGQQYFSNEMGPITWPSTGYLQPNGAKATTGVSHPSSIQYNGYVYVFYRDAGPYAGLNPHSEEGRQEGIKVVRAPLAGALDPHAYEVYYRDTSGEEHWSPSLPEGFDKDNLQAYLRVQGPRSTDLMGDEGNNLFGSLRFSVARVRDHDYFIGVESYIDHRDGRKYKTALRFSNDLLHWTDRRMIIDVATDFTTSLMNYPILLSADGWSNSVVDENDLYVLGTGAAINNVVYKKHIMPAGQSSTPRAQSAGGPILSGGPVSSLQVMYVAPNPARGVCRLSYQISEYALVRVNVLDMAGRRLVKGIPVQRAPGSYTEPVDLSGFAGGVYLLELVTGKEKRILKVIRE